MILQVWGLSLRYGAQGMGPVAASTPRCMPMLRLSFKARPPCARASDVQFTQWLTRRGCLSRVGSLRLDGVVPCIPDPAPWLSMVLYAH